MASFQLPQPHGEREPTIATYQNTYICMGLLLHLTRYIKLRAVQMLSGAKLIVRHVFKEYKISEAIYFHCGPYYLCTTVLDTTFC